MGTTAGESGGNDEVVMMTMIRMLVIYDNDWTQ